MPINPYADLDLPPELKQAAEDVHVALSRWIDQQVVDLKTQMNSRAAVVAGQITSEAQLKLTDVLNMADGELKAIQDNLAAIKTTFTASTAADFQVMADKLQSAIAAHRAAVANQQVQIQQYGKLIGSMVQKALLA